MNKIAISENSGIDKSTSTLNTVAGLEKNIPFEINKTFGLGVLLKLTKKNVPGIEISTFEDRFVSNVTLNKLKDAVECTMKLHNIQLKV